MLDLAVNAVKYILMIAEAIGMTIGLERMAYQVVGQSICLEININVKSVGRLYGHAEFFILHSRSESVIKK
jgi:hypothetical protein